MDKENRRNNIQTGTTIVGIVCKDGIVMAGDNRLSLGQSLVIGKDYEKVYPINDYLVYAGCGSATESQKISKLLAAELKLKHLKSKKRPTVRQAASLLSNIQATESAFILAGFDENGEAFLYEITGGLLRQMSEYTASVGSGLMYVLGYLERQWKPDLSIEEGVKLAIESIKSSSARDMATGNGVDIYTITKEGIKKVLSQKVEVLYKDKQ